MTTSLVSQRKLLLLHLLQTKLMLLKLLNLNLLMVQLLKKRVLPWFKKLVKTSKCAVQKSLKVKTLQFTNMV